MSRPLVTALITNYNYDEFLAEAIESALQQTYGSLEVVVVDDGSTDSSRDVIARFGDAVVPVFQDNLGQAKSFEAGLSRARGGLVCFLDADDVWLPEKVERVVDDGWSSGAALIYHRIQRVDASLRPWGRAYPRSTRFADLADRSRRSGGWWVAPPTSALSCRADYLGRIRPFPQVYRICADAYVTSVAPFVGEVHGIKEALSLVRRHGRNSWRGDVDRVAELRRRADMYQLTVAELNAALGRLGVDAQVRLVDHWPYRAALAELHGRLPSRDVALGMRYPAEKNPLRRVRDVGRAWLRARRGRDAAR